MKRVTLTRKQFLGAASGGTLLLLLQACGGGGSGYSATPAPTGSSSGITSCGASGSAIAGNHGHMLAIPLADLDSTTDKTYSIQGTANHDHQITLTVAQLQSLKAGQPVVVTSTTTLSHNHDVTNTCA